MEKQNHVTCNNPSHNVFMADGRSKSWRPIHDLWDRDPLVNLTDGKSDFTKGEIYIGLPDSIACASNC